MQYATRHTQKCVQCRTRVYCPTKTNLTMEKIFDKINPQLECDDDNFLQMQKIDNRARSKHHTCQPGAAYKQCFGKELIEQLKFLYANKRKLN
jgi:hypothetical protein